MDVGQDELQGTVDVCRNCAVGRRLSDCLGLLADSTMFDAMVAAWSFDASLVVLADDSRLSFSRMS